MLRDQGAVGGQEMNYMKLLQAVDFFCQSLHIEQLSYYGFELVHQALGFDKSCLFILENGSYVMKYEKNYGISTWVIPETEQHHRAATLFGRIMTSEQANYFSESDLEKFSAKIVIPQINKDRLVGFIFSNGRRDGSFTDETLIMAGALMQLMNRSYENAVNYVDLEKKNYELDKKIFNLFFVNHCSRTLLSELNLDRIYGICIDIIRELTASSVTAFGLYDDIRDRIVIKGWQDIVSFQTYYGEFKLKQEAPLPTRVVYSLEHDRSELAAIFEDVEALKALKAQYIVMLMKDRILGFVSIGAPVSERAYDQVVFELIETIATSIYIAIVNARLFESVSRQSEAAQKKFETMESMNRILRNINSCDSLEELCAIAMKSLEIGYGVRKSVICLYRDGALRVMGQVGMPECQDVALSPGPKLKALDDTGMTYDFTARNVEQFLRGIGPNKEDEANCMILAPIRIDRLALGDQGTLGYLGVFQTENALREEEILLIDTLSNSMAPIVFQMNETRRVQSCYIENQEQLLLEDIEEKLQNRELYAIDFRVWYKRMAVRPFERTDVSQFSEYPSYMVEGVLFSPMEDDVEPMGFDNALKILDIYDFIRQVKLI